jgi:hypothetical protein
VRSPFPGFKLIFMTAATMQVSFFQRCITVHNGNQSGWIFLIMAGKTFHISGVLHRDIPMGILPGRK